MPLTNQSKPTTTLANTTKVSFAELWSTITTTWASETRYWEDMASVLSNVTVAGQGIWSSKFLPWRETAPWQNAAPGMTNTSKPS